MIESLPVLADLSSTEGGMNLDPTLMSVLDDHTRSAVAGILENLDDTMRGRIVEGVQLLEAVEAEVPALVSVLKGKDDGLPIPDEHRDALRGLYDLARRHRPW